MPVIKRNANDAGDDMYDIPEEAKSYIEKILGDVGKTSAMKQIAIGTSSGWMTGYIMMKVGKLAAFALGGGIIILQIAAHQGYIKINWDKIRRKAEKISDKVEEKVTGEGPKFLDKVERYVDNKCNKAEKLLKEGESSTRRWYNSVVGRPECTVKEFHVFLGSFLAGFAIGVAITK
ncbi:FUN14 domain-containing protein 1 [Orussus abietinus]|uniref:FUN14 domain-containing protein 1 n=1 Tax=Orussus abietinus TaxID=222816 RepID=UPI0006263102|nr:FUN14 domain-containing protein 1 [Orussus abietinus]